jgi:hypothetical protein
MAPGYPIPRRAGLNAATQEPGCRGGREGALQASPRMDRPEGQHGGVLRQAAFQPHRDPEDTVRGYDEYDTAPLDQLDDATIDDAGPADAIGVDVIDLTDLPF